MDKLFEAKEKQPKKMKSTEREHRTGRYSRNDEGILYQLHSSWELFSFQTDEIKTKNKEAEFFIGKQPDIEQGDFEWMILDLSKTGIINIPPKICQFIFLKELYIQKNFLQEIPIEVCRLSMLKVLNLSQNMIRELPVEICKLVELQSLVVCDNMIGELPAELGSLWQLEQLVLDGNPLREPFSELYQTYNTTDFILFIRENILSVVEPSPRVWHFVENIELSNDAFMTLSYNILGNKFTSSSIYGYTPSWVLDWERRKMCLLEEILSHNADIVCLQEVEQQCYEDLLVPHLGIQGGYSFDFLQKTKLNQIGIPKRPEIDGCATFFKTQKYTFLEKHIVELNKLSFEKEDEGKNMYQRVSCRDNVALVLLLKNNKTKKTILVGNIHLHWDPKQKDVKLIQTILFLEELSSFQNIHKANSVLLCGDFNSLPDSGVYTLLSTGKIDQTHPDFGGFVYEPYTQKGFGHSFHFQSAYSQAKELPATCFSNRFQGTLDYIWYSSHRLSVVGLLGPLSPEYISQTGGLPNAYFPSDHIPLVSEFQEKTEDSNPYNTQNTLFFRNKDPIS